MERRRRVRWPMESSALGHTKAWEICLAPVQVLNVEDAGVPVSLILQPTRWSMLIAKELIGYQADAL